MCVFIKLVASMIASTPADNHVHVDKARCIDAREHTRGQSNVNVACASTLETGCRYKLHAAGSFLHDTSVHERIFTWQLTAGSQIYMHTTWAAQKLELGLY